MKFTADIAKEYACDVLVVGGGVAGVFAAIAAGRMGADVILVEKDGMLGGTATMGGVDFPGIFHAWGKQIIGGPCWESILRAEALGGAQIPEIVYQPKDHWLMQVRINPFVYAQTLDEMCREAGVRLLLHTMPAWAKETESGVSAVLAMKEGMAWIDAKCAVDATGDANLAAMLGLELEYTQTLQPGTLMNRITGYSIENVCREEVERAFEGVDLQGNGMWHMLQIGKINLHMEVPEAHTSEGRTQLEIRSRRLLAEIVQRCRSVAGLENLCVEWAAPEFGVRESRRIVGLHRITEQEYSTGAGYEDGVCHSFYPIDLHVEGGIDIRPLPEGVVPSIPYRALVPKGAKRVWAAGRCISGDARAASAYRVQASCMAMGQVSGAAAALSVKDNVSAAELDIDALRERLTALGCIVPQ